MMLNVLGMLVLATVCVLCAPLRYGYVQYEKVRRFMQSKEPYLFS